MDRYVLILSEPYEPTVDLVIKWLKSFNCKVIRINKQDNIHVSNLSIDSNGIRFTLNLEERKFSLDSNSIKSFWYRKGKVHLSDKIKIEEDLLYDGINKMKTVGQVNSYLENESKRVDEFLHYYLENYCPKSLGKKSNSTNNKLIHLTMAQEVGLEIPETLIRDSIIDCDGDNSYITKSISDSRFFDVEDDATNEESIYINYTTDIPTALRRKLISRRWRLSLFQEKIEKEFEIRIFYLYGKCYSMAIFSQKDNQTAVDFRKYNWYKPNRCVPFYLPNDISDKLDKFMDRANLTTGSIDLVYTKDDRYLFLEVNPVGQFGMVSYPCNYNLEKEVAKALI